MKFMRVELVEVDEKTGKRAMIASVPFTPMKRTNDRIAQFSDAVSEMTGLALDNVKHWGTHLV